MKLIITLKEASEKCDIVDFCAATCIDFDQLDQISDDAEFTLDIDDAEFLGLTDFKEEIKDRNEFPVYAIQNYLIDLQSGKFGAPTMEQLQEAGVLHHLLETHQKEK